MGPNPLVSFASLFGLTDLVRVDRSVKKLSADQRLIGPALLNEVASSPVVSPQWALTPATSSTVEDALRTAQ